MKPSSHARHEFIEQARFGVMTKHRRVVQRKVLADGFSCALETGGIAWIVLDEDARTSIRVGTVEAFVAVDVQSDFVHAEDVIVPEGCGVLMAWS